MSDKLDLDAAFGKALKQIRYAKGISQEDFSAVIDRTFVSMLERGLKTPTIQTVEKVSSILGIHPIELLSLTFAIREDQNLELHKIKYIKNTSNTTNFKYTEDESQFSPEDVERSMEETNRIVTYFSLLFNQVAKINLYEVIDKKLTGSFIGSIFVERMANNAKYLAKNPSQTGHPDLIPVKYLNTNEKFNWDQFPYGGVEVKTSSGDLKNGITNSMKIGETRINHITNIVWKGHHTQINNLLGLYWDYYNGLPTLLGAFYSNQLTPDEFTNTIPKIGGGHTTSVCITKKSAREKMMKNWVVIPDMAD